MKTLRRQNVRAKLYATDGKIFGVEFIKRTTGRKRRMAAKITSNRSKNYNLIIVYDMSQEAIRSIPIDGLRRLRVNGEVFRII